MERVSALAPEVPFDLHYCVVMPTDEPGALRLGRLIRQARVDLGWTQKDLAEESGVSIETIKRYENGKIKSPESELVRNIVRALGIDVREVPVALGLVTREEMDLPPVQPRRFDPEVEEAISILQDPLMSDMAKQGALQYLRFLLANVNAGDETPGAKQPRAS